MPGLSLIEKRHKQKLKADARGFKKACAAYRKGDQTKLAAMQLHGDNLVGKTRDANDGSKTDDNYATLLAEFFHNDWNTLFAVLALIDDQATRKRISKLAFTKVLDRRKGPFRSHSRPSKAVLAEMGGIMLEVLKEKQNGEVLPLSKTRQLFSEMLEEDNRFADFVLRRASYLGQDERDLDKRDNVSADDDGTPPLIVRSLVHARCVTVNQSALQAFHNANVSVKKPFKWRLPYFIRRLFARPDKTPHLLVQAVVARLKPVPAAPAVAAPPSPAAAAVALAGGAASSSGEQYVTRNELARRLGETQQQFATKQELTGARSEISRQYTTKRELVDAQQSMQRQIDDLSAKVGVLRDEVNAIKGNLPADTAAKVAGIEAQLSTLNGRVTSLGVQRSSHAAAGGGAGVNRSSLFAAPPMPEAPVTPPPSRTGNAPLSPLDVVGGAASPASQLPMGSPASALPDGDSQYEHGEPIAQPNFGAQ